MAQKSTDGGTFVMGNHLGQEKLGRFGALGAKFCGNAFQRMSSQS